MGTSLKRQGEPGARLGGSRRIPSLVREHRSVAIAIAGGVIVLGVLAFLWFRPDKIFVDKSVNEALPTAPAPGASASPGASAVLSSGSFRNLEHPTSGVAKIIEVGDGARVVRLEDFRTSSGPDVVVILSSTAATEDDWGAYDDGTFVNLGELRGNVGSQNYTIPANVDLSKYRSVVIWCRRFNVAFGAAPIT